MMNDDIHDVSPYHKKSHQYDGVNLKEIVRIIIKTII